MDRLIKPSGNVHQTAVRKGEMESELDASTWNVSDQVAITSTPLKGNRDLAGSNDRRGSGSLHQSHSAGRQAQHHNQPNESRDLMLEYLAQYACAPDFMTNLWVNYDCNVDCEDLFERLIKFFSRVSALAARLGGRHADVGLE